MTDSGITVNGEPVVSDVNVTNTSIPVSVNDAVSIQNAGGANLSVAQPHAQVYTFSLAPGAAVASQPFTVPAGMDALAVIVTNGQGTDHLTNISINTYGGNAPILSASPCPNSTILYGITPTPPPGSLLPTCLITASAATSNFTTMVVTVIGLPPGTVTVSEIINTPGNPVYVNLAQPDGRWAVTSEPQPGAVGPSITHTPPTGKSAYVTYATAGLLQNSTTAFISYARLSGTFNGVANTTVWEGPLGVDGVQGHSAQCPPFSGGAIKFDLNTSVTLSLSGTLPASGVYGMLSMLGYDQ